MYTQKKKENLYCSTKCGSSKLQAMDTFLTISTSLSVRNIPNFGDSCDIMELLFSRKMADKTCRVHCFKVLRHISKTISSAAYQKPNWKCLVKYHSALFVAYFSFL